jgi:hypothetical protein
MYRTRNIIIAVIALVVFSHFAFSNKDDPGAKPTNPHKAAPMPLPAGEPTAAPSVRSKQDAKLKKQQRPKRAKHDYERSAISAPQRKYLQEAVRLYASWPGKPRETLLKQLRSLRPLITEQAISQIKASWRNTPPTFTMKVKGVILDPSLTAAAGNGSKAALSAYVTLVRHFTPVSGSPNDQKATQPYTVSLRVIDREWRVVSISPQIPPTPPGG